MEEGKRKRVPIGKGKSGHVYMEWSEDGSKKWVIKKSREYPANEMTMLFLLHDYEVPAFLGLGVDDDENWELRMSYLPGTTLQEIIEIGQKSWQERLEILHNLALVLERIKRNFPTRVFLDLKPSNIMVDKDHHVHIIDLEQVMEAGRVEEYCATATYIPPEVVIRSEVLPNSDIYNLGRVFEETDREVHLLFRFLVVRGCLRFQPFRRFSMKKVVRRITLYEKVYRLWKRIAGSSRQFARWSIDFMVCVCILFAGYGIIKFTVG